MSALLLDTPVTGPSRTSRPSTRLWWLVLVTALAMLVAIAAAAVNIAWPFISAHFAPPRRESATATTLVPPPIEDQRLMPVSPDAALTLNAQKAFVAGPIVPARPYRFVGNAENRERAITCLAVAGWYEAGDDPTGERAVMQVILNRVRHPAFPTSVCAVVFQGAERTTGCQFTFTCDGSLARRSPSGEAWLRSRTLAIAALDGSIDARVGYATFYHANYVVPYWADDYDKIVQVGLHLFYRWKGYWGTRAAFTRGSGADEPGYAALALLSPAHGLAEGAIVLPNATLPPDAKAPPASVPPALVVEGVREKSLRGAVVRGQQTDSNRYFIQVDANAFPGNYATAAVALCKGKTTCLVLGWRDATTMANALPLATTPRAALSFYFSQGADGSYKVLWNCQQTPRTNKAQCLPSTGPIPI
ncbi:cell wall hydrolase [uncultured Sphingomonas sp.]|uniref:cell wall hydrolase n=1 Tax=uncultured Sphingomonas sp. TaxID=158754 RepID=UPI0035CAB095